jgi:hypothetical protein
MSLSRSSAFGTGKIPKSGSGAAMGRTLPAT